MTDDSFRGLQFRLLRNPDAGTVIPGTGGVRKLRVADRGKGTRGGGRVIYIVRHRTGRIYLLSCYAKAEKEDLTSDERREWHRLASQMR